jgi:hypothetical protein
MVLYHILLMVLNAGTHGIGSLSAADHFLNALAVVVMQARWGKASNPFLVVHPPPELIAQGIVPAQAAVWVASSREKINAEVSASSVHYDWCSAKGILDVSAPDTIDGDFALAGDITRGPRAEADQCCWSAFEVPHQEAWRTDEGAVSSSVCMQQDCMDVHRTSCISRRHQLDRV